MCSEDSLAKLVSLSRSLRLGANHPTNGGSEEVLAAVFEKLSQYAKSDMACEGFSHSDSFSPKGNALHCIVKIYIRYIYIYISEVGGSEGS